MTGILRIRNRYWKLNEACDIDVARARIKAGLIKTNATAEKFIKAVNEFVGIEWIACELDPRKKHDYDVIYSTATKYLWTITLNARHIELKERDLKKRSGNCWNTLFSAAIRRS